MTGQKRNHLWTYIILSISISALCWLVPLINAQDNGYLVPTAANFFTLLEQGLQNSKHALISLLFAAATFGPFLGAVAATRLESGADGVARLFARVWKWRVERRWYGVVLILDKRFGNESFLPSSFTDTEGIYKNKNYGGVSSGDGGGSGGCTDPWGCEEGSQ